MEQGSHTGPGAAGQPCRSLPGAPGDPGAQGLGLGGPHLCSFPPLHSCLALGLEKSSLLSSTQIPTGLSSPACLHMVFSHQVSKVTF